jgi:hypothetical protein
VQIPFVVGRRGWYKKLLQQPAQKFIESLKIELSKIWEKELNIPFAHLAEKALLVQELEGPVPTLSDSGPGV